jgi:hypothetical protein
VTRECRVDVAFRRAVVLRVDTVLMILFVIFARIFVHRW